MSNLLSQASLVMIPSGYKEDVVYSQIPTDGSGDLTFTRASNGTRVNSAGLVEVAPWNLAQYSNDFSNGVWVTSGYGNLPTLTANSIANPLNGLVDAWTASFAASGTQGRLLQTFTGLPVGVPYTYSMYVKAGTKTSVVIYSDTASIGLNAAFNLSNGTITSTSGVTATITAMSNGWYYLNITNNILSSGNGQYGIVTNTGEDGSLYIYGAQLNIGSTAKPYFPTTDRLNVPRLTYQNGGGGCPSLLLEKQSTNLFLYSEEFDNGAWSPIGSTITANNTTSPDGTQNADKITEDSSNGLHLFYNSGGVSAGAGTWTISIFYKKGTRRYFAIKMQIGSSSYTQVFDADGLTTGGSSSNGLTSVSSTIVSMGNGWVRATLTGTDASGGGSGYGIFSLSNSLNPSFDPTNYNPTYQGSSSEYGYFWGAQLE